MSTYQAKLYQASSPNAEYMGGLVMAFAHNLRADAIQPILAKHGFENIDPTAWYPQQQVLNVFRDIESRFSFEELVAIGMGTAELNPLPPQVNSIEMVVVAADAIYKSGCRNADPAEGMMVNKVGARHYEITYNIPLPPFAIYGVLYGLIRRVKSKNDDPRIHLTRRETPAVMEVKW